MSDFDVSEAVTPLSVARISSEVRTITPDEARSMLAANIGNRNLRKTVVTRYAADMRAGRWHVGTGMIIIDSSGVLIDGQHRLHACVEADTPFMTLVVSGVAPAAKTGIDQGLKRTFGDVLRWRGESHSTQLAAAARALWQWKKGALLRRNYAPTFDEMMEVLGRNPGLRDAVTPAQQLYSALACPKPTSTVVLHRLRLIDVAAANEFFGQVKDGVNLSHGAPALTLRNWMANQSVAATSARRPLSQHYHYMWVKAWNAHMLGKDLKQLKLVVREEFPALLDQTGSPVDLVDEVEL